MKKKIISIVMVLLWMTLGAALSAQTAFAAETPGISIPVKISLSGTLPSEAESFSVKLLADQESYPMPEGAVNGVYSMIITGGGSRSFPMVFYDRPGIYTYTIFQEPGTNAKCTYDRTIYALTVYVTNAEDGSGLETAAVLHPSSGGDKLAEAVFRNQYETEEAPPPDDNPGTPSVITPVPPAVAVLGDSAVPVIEIPPAPEIGVLGEAQGPGTGDTAPVVLWFAVFAGAAVVLAGFCFYSRRRSGPDEEKEENGK